MKHIIRYFGIAICIVLPSEVPAWQLKEETNPMTDKASIWIEKEAQTVKDHSESLASAKFFIQCECQAPALWSTLKLVVGLGRLSLLPPLPPHGA